MARELDILYSLCKDFLIMFKAVYPTMTASPTTKTTKANTNIRFSIPTMNTMKFMAPLYTITPYSQVIRLSKGGELK